MPHIQVLIQAGKDDLYDDLAIFTSCVIELTLVYCRLCSKAHTFRNLHYHRLSHIAVCKFGIQARIDLTYEIPRRAHNAWSRISRFGCTCVAYPLAILTLHVTVRHHPIETLTAGSHSKTVPRPCCRAWICPMSCLLG